jgi:hypothetical protein
MSGEELYIFLILVVPGSALVGAAAGWVGSYCLGQGTISQPIQEILPANNKT